MKLLVTGATGCVGRNLIETLLAMGWEVDATGRNQKVGSLLEKQGARFYQANLEDRETIISLCEDKDIVFHCGAFSSPWGNYRDFYHANVIGTQNIVTGCLKHHVKRLVYVSTPSLYFNFKEKHHIAETDPLPVKSVNHYAATKGEAEKVVDRAFKEEGLAVVTIRPRAIFGPYDQAIMPRIIRAAKKGRLPLINGGDALIDATYVGNVVQSLILAANASDDCLGKKYNITNGEPIILRELLEKSFLALGLAFKPRIIPYPLAYAIAAMMELVASMPFVTKEPILTKYAVGVFGIGQTLDITAAKRDLGYEPLISMQQGIDHFAQWWKEENNAY